MALHRPFAFVVAAAALPPLAGGCSGVNGGAPPPSLAVADTASVDALRDQQIHLIDEIRQLRAETAQLAAAVEQLASAAASAKGWSDAGPTPAAPEESNAPAPSIQEPPPIGGESGGGAESADPASAAPPTSGSASPAHHWVDVARHLIDDQDYATAVRVLNVGADVDPNYDDLYFQRGVARHLLQDYEDAIDDFQAAIQRTHRQDLRYICLYNQACGLARLKRPEEAIEKLVQSDAAGFRELLQQMSIDPDLDSLREIPRFRDFAMDLRTR